MRVNSVGGGVTPRILSLRLLPRPAAGPRAIAGPLVRSARDRHGALVPAPALTSIEATLNTVTRMGGATTHHS